MNTKIAFIGLGVMGFPMAGHLARAGYQVTVFNRTRHKAEHWLSQHLGQQADTPAQAAQDADVVLSCVGNDDDLRAVLCGPDGALTGARPGTLFIDHTTASARVARELDALCRQQRCHFMDAPVSGGQQGAENGQLTVMCGGDADTFTKVKVLTACYSKAITHMGPVGNGQLTKMVNQICVVGVLQGLAEGMAFAEQAGLDVQRVIDAIAQGAASSWQMVNRHRTMIAGEYEHGFALDWMVKDLGLCEQEAAVLSADLSVTSLIKGYYEQLQADGKGRWDTSALLARLQSLPSG